MRRLVERRFDGWINHKFKRQEIKDHLINHERKQIILDNICQQCERVTMKTMDPIEATKRMALVIDTSAGMFCKAALEYVEQQYMSQSAKNKIRTDADRIKDLEDYQEELREEFKDDLKEEDKSL